METLDATPGAGIDPEDIGYAPGAPVAAPPDYSGPTTSEPFLPNPVQPARPPLPSEGGALPPNWWIKQPPQSAQPSAWSATPFVQGVFEKGLAGTKEGSAAITQALRLEGILGFDADRKAGVPVAEAMAKWAPKMYADHPSVAAELSKRQEAPFVPNMINVGGEDLIQMSPKRYSFRPKVTGEALKQADIMHGTTAELSALSKAIATEDDPVREKALRAQHAEALDRLHKMTSQAKGVGKSAEGTRVRDKKTGKTFRYKGDASHIPKDQYDILE